MKKNNSLLIAILSGTVFCFILLGLMFIFPGKNSNLKGNDYNINNDISHNEFNLGDTCSPKYYCASGLTLVGTNQCCDYVLDSSLDETACNAEGGTYVGGACYSSCYDATPGTSCTSCDAGKRLYNGACVKCGAGTYGEGGTSTTCTACPPGKYSEAAGQVMCASCANLPDGDVRYQPDEGQTECLRCPDNQVANADHTGCVNVATNCNPGEYSENGECKPCPAGNYCTGTGVIPCPKGTAASTTAVRTSCTPCTGNQYQDQTGQLVCKTCDGEVNENHTTCTPTCSSRTQDTCEDLEGCKWQDNSCVFVKACSTIIDKNECQGRNDCAWDTSWTTYCHDKPPVITTLSVTPYSGKVYVAADYPVRVDLLAKDENGNEINVSWSSPKSSLVTKDCGGTTTSRCSYTFKSDTCGSYEETITATDISGNKKSVTISATKYDIWKPTIHGKTELPDSARGKTRDAMMFEKGCYAYEGSYQEGGKWYYTEGYNRCCGGGTPRIPHCYIDNSGNYKWTYTPEASWKLVEGISKEEDCNETEKEACYKTPEGTYDWGKHAKDVGYILITSIDNADACKTPDSEYACYKNEQGDYRWEKEAPEGYTKVDGVSSPEECGPEESPACYYHDGKPIWGKYAKVTGYIRIENVDSEDECKLPEKEACYVDKNGDYKWGKYANDPDYKLVPSVTEIGQCKNNIPVPPTGISISKVVYIFMAILMAFGVGFIYYSSTVKKTN